MVLVDTSVWIRFLANRPVYGAGLDRLLSLDQAAGHQFVYGELLIGDRSGRKKLLEAYERIHPPEVVSHGEVAAFVRDRRLHGRGMGWICVHLLASAIVGRMVLWTAGTRLAAAAREFGVAYEPLNRRLLEDEL